MPEGSKILYLQSHEINRSLWDNCINNACNRLVYAQSVYLDHMADNWDALVLDNYEAVMPLPWRRKSGFYYLYQPFLTAQLGLFSASVNKELLKKFLSAIPKKFSLWEFPLNHDNRFAIEGFELYERKNYILNLSPEYDLIIKNFRENTRRNIKRCLQYGCYGKNDIDIEDVISLAGYQNSPIRTSDIKNFKNLYKHFQEKDQAICYGVFSSRHELIASAAFVFSYNRAYYILVGNHPNGRTLGASHLLIDHFIKEHSGNELFLDFEGSDIRNLAFFYSSFGAKEENYMAIRLNRLPWYVRVFKR